MFLAYGDAYGGLTEPCVYLTAAQSTLQSNVQFERPNAYVKWLGLFSGAHIYKYIRATKVFSEMDEAVAVGGRKVCQKALGGVPREHIWAS